MCSRLTTLTVTALTFGVTAAALAGDLTYPAAWEGVWDVTAETRDCASDFLYGTDEYTDVVCEGDIFELESGFNCTGTVTDTSYDVSCADQTTVLPDCVAFITFDSEGTRSGDSYSAVTIITTEYVGAGCTGTQDTCLRIEEEATRTGADPDCVNTPVDGASWGEIKLRFE
jgi:hypothetical protein